MDIVSQPEKWILFDEEKVLVRLEQIAKKIRYSYLKDPFFEKTLQLLQINCPDPVKTDNNVIWFMFEMDRGRPGKGFRYYLTNGYDGLVMTKGYPYGWRDKQTQVEIHKQIKELTGFDLLEALRQFFVQEIMEF